MPFAETHVLITSITESMTLKNGVYCVWQEETASSH
jgi:hypothetical protein